MGRKQEEAYLPANRYFFFNVRQIMIQREEPTAQKSKPRARIIHSQEAEPGIMKGLVACAWVDFRTSMDLWLLYTFCSFPFWVGHSIWPSNLCLTISVWENLLLSSQTLWSTGTIFGDLYSDENTYPPKDFYRILTVASLVMLLRWTQCKWHLTMKEARQKRLHTVWFHLYIVEEHAN